MLWSEFDQHLTTASPRAAQWACGSSHLESDQQSSQPHLHKDPKRSSLVVRCRVLQTNCTFLGRAMGLWVTAVEVRPTIITTAIHKSPERYRICCIKCWLLQDLNTSPFSRSVLPILLNSSSFTGSEKRENHVPHVIFFEDALFTHASFVHQCLFTSGAASSRQGHPATWQVHSHSRTLLTAGGPGFQDRTNLPDPSTLLHIPLTRG